MAAPRAGAYTLFWASNDWTAGALTQTFANVQNSGVDVRITVSGDTSGDIAANFPDDRMTNSPLPDARRALWLRIDNWESTNEAVTVTVQFFVTNTTTPTNVLVSGFSVFDIDAHNSTGTSDKYRDELRGWGASSTTNIGSFNVLPTASYATNAANATFQIITNSGGFTTRLTAKSPPYGNTTLYDAPQGTNAGYQKGTANLNFGSYAIGEFRYTYGNNGLTNFSGVLSSFNPTLQWTALGDISFDYVPEPGTFAALALAAGILFCLRRRIRRA